MIQRHQDIRDAVAQVCSQYPGEYWREKDREQHYPSEFVGALTEAGFLSCLIPEEYGGSGLGISEAAAVMEEIQAALASQTELLQAVSEHQRQASAAHLQTSIAAAIAAVDEVVLGLKGAAPRLENLAPRTDAMLARWCSRARLSYRRRGDLTVQSSYRYLFTVRTVARGAGQDCGARRGSGEGGAAACTSAKPREREPTATLATPL